MNTDNKCYDPAFEYKDFVVHLLSTRIEREDRDVGIGLTDELDVQIDGLAPGVEGNEGEGGGWTFPERVENHAIHLLYAAVRSLRDPHHP